MKISGRIESQTHRKNMSVEISDVRTSLEKLIKTHITDVDLGYVDVMNFYFRSGSIISMLILN